MHVTNWFSTWVSIQAPFSGLIWVLILNSGMNYELYNLDRSRVAVRVQGWVHYGTDPYQAHRKWKCLVVQVGHVWSLTVEVMDHV